MPRPSPLVVALLAALPVALGRLVLATTPLELHTGITPLSQALNVAWSGLWIVVAVVAYVRQPDEPLWRVITAYLVASQIWLLGYVTQDLVWSFATAFNAVEAAVLGHLLVSFPTGRLRPGFERAFVRLLYAWTIGAGILGGLVLPSPSLDPSCTGFCPTNVFAVVPDEGLADLVSQVSSGAAPLFGLIVIGLVLRHFVQATPVLRRVLRPIAIATPLVVLQEVLWYVTRAFGLDAINELLATVAFWFVDFLIPVGILLGLLQARFQRTAVAGLAVKLAQGVPLGGMRELLARTLRDPTLELAFATADGDELVDPDGRPFAPPAPERTDRSTTRIERDGRLLAVLVHDRQLDVEDPGLVEAVASVARLSLENERLAAQVRAQLDEVRASRQRIVEAADAERRRVERDLHDGAQQRLVALTMRLEAARATTAGVGELIDRTTDELRAAITEVRALARGLHPTVLSEAGLRAAVEALAERTPIPVTVDIPTARFPEAVEVTAYYVVAEALTNVAKYAGASGATVRVDVDGDRLVIRVTDDGRGGADPEGGTGLRGLLDRVAAVGGSLSVESPPGAGTSLTATLPV